MEGEDSVEKVVLHDLDEDFELVVDRVVLAVGMTPNTEIYSKLGVEVDDRGFIKVDRDQRTNLGGFTQLVTGRPTCSSWLWRFIGFTSTFRSKRVFKP
ncbi:MAG: FAD-dependent oxidoreductase [Candidatus Freyarchaeota archaeon]